MHRNDRLDHQRFREIAALAQRGMLSDSEQSDLELHLQTCISCRQAYEEYVLIGTEAMGVLAAVYGENHNAEAWDDGAVREALMARVRAADEALSPVKAARSQTRDGFANYASASWIGFAVAACVLVTVAIGAYKLGGYVSAVKPLPAAPPIADFQIAALDKTQSDKLTASANARIEQLQIQAFKNQLEISKLKDALHAAQTRSASLTSANQERDEKIHQVSEERDKLATQVLNAEQSYQALQGELTNLHNEYDRVAVRTSSLQSKIDELTTAAHDQERRIDDDEQYLASDRDIRELMGARKLYIADVFDVDSGSRTRKPFGRVFYTQSKSLIFYAFDLDHQPGVKTASAFQVWGQRDAESGEKNPAMNLGILYMDSESSRRWVLRLDDPKQLAEIDAVFVTVEPHGGSQKPTGKPFLYALLRKEANHP